MIWLIFAALFFGTQVTLGAALDITIDLRSTIATSSPLLSSFGWEAWQMLDSLHEISDPRSEAIAGHLSPSVIRVGGITADWFRYVLDSGLDSSTDELVGRTVIGNEQHLVGGFWPTAPENITLSQFYNLTAFMKRSNLSLLFDLNELFGRNCNTTKPGCPSCNDWCGSSPTFPGWDTSNVRDFLQRLHDDKMAGGNNSLFGFELGNELAGHLDPAENTADILALSEMIHSIWSDVSESERPIFVAPSTDDCYDNYGQTSQIMKNVSKAVDAFSFHAYPAGDGHDLVSLLTNASWLRTGILTGSNAQQCLDDWNNVGPREDGMGLWVTEASSSWNWQGSTDPPWPPGQPGQNSFMHGFFTLSELGTYAKLGVPVVARWAFALGGSFGLLSYAPSPIDRFDVAADFWVILAQKRLMGEGVLSVSGDDVADSNVLAFAQCTSLSALENEHYDISRMRKAGSGLRVRELLSIKSTGNVNGSITIMAVNVGTEPSSLSLLAAGVGAGNIATTPRLEYIFTAQDGDIGSLSSLLNDDTTPLRVLPDGSLPSLTARYVDVGGAADLTLPPLSQAFFVLLNAGASACQ